MPEKSAISLDDMIAKKRKQKASELATAMLGKKRLEKKGPSSGNGSGGIGKQPQQRIVSSGSGIGNAAKVTAGRNTINGQWTHDLHHKNNPQASRVSKLPTTISPAIARSLQNNRLFAALHSDQVNPVVPTAPNTNKSSKPGKNIRRHSGGAINSGVTGGGNGKGVLKRSGSATGLRSTAGLSIRGSAGPAVIQASNFAPGTTAEDIKHAMAPLGKILSCIILTAQPTVICEVVFDTKASAEQCVAQYNQQIADGRLLHVFVKPGPPAGRIPGVNAPPSGNRQDRDRDSYRYEDPMDLDAQREEADRRRREANITYQDGRYGVAAPSLYSDALIQRGRGFTR